MTAFEKWSGFLLQLAEVYLPIAPQEKERLEAELSVLEKENGAELFQAIYDAWHLLKIKGVHSYIQGEAEEWFTFYFLGMAGENPIKKEMPTKVPIKITLVIEKK